MSYYRIMPYGTKAFCVQYRSTEESPWELLKFGGMGRFLRIYDAGYDKSISFYFGSVEAAKAYYLDGLAMQRLDEEVAIEAQKRYDSFEPIYLD